jgi:hypothetical protein
MRSSKVSKAVHSHECLSCSSGGHRIVECIQIVIYDFLRERCSEMPLDEGIVFVQ